MSRLTETERARACWVRPNDPAEAELREFAAQAPHLDFDRAILRARLDALTRATRHASGKVSEPAERHGTLYIPAKRPAQSGGPE